MKEITEEPYKTWSSSPIKESPQTSQTTLPWISHVHALTLEAKTADCKSKKETYLLCENLFSCPWSITSITRTKVIIHSTNIFVNLVKLMQRVQDRRREKKELYSFNNGKTFFFIWVMSYIYKLRKRLLPLITFLMTWTRSNPITSISHSLIKN
jgi:hypothetical protein